MLGCIGLLHHCLNSAQKRIEVKWKVQVLLSLPWFWIVQNGGSKYFLILEEVFSDFFSIQSYILLKYFFFQKSRCQPEGKIQRLQQILETPVLLFKYTSSAAIILDLEMLWFMEGRKATRTLFAFDPQMNDVTKYICRKTLSLRDLAQKGLKVKPFGRKWIDVDWKPSGWSLL